MTIFEKYFDITLACNAPHFAAIQKRPVMEDSELRRVVALFGHDVKYLYFLLRFQNITVAAVDLALAGYWGDDIQVAAWQAESRANEAEIRHRKGKAKEDGRNLLFEALEPVKEIYQKTPFHLRRFVLADIIRYITN
jgi:hypothetical protein